MSRRARHVLCGLTGVAVVAVSQLSTLSTGWARASGVSVDSRLVLATVPAAPRLLPLDDPQDARAAAPDEYVDVVAKMLDKSLVAIPERVARAEQYYEEARTSRPQDPWLHYAYALVLVQAGRLDAALAHMESPPRAERGSELALRQLLLRTRCSVEWTQKELDGLRELGRLLETDKDFAADDVERTDGAVFLGQMVAYLAGPGAKHTEWSEDIKTLDRQLRGRLKESRRLGYDHGKAAVMIRYQQLRATAEDRNEERQAVLKEELNNRGQQLEAGIGRAEQELTRGAYQAQQEIVLLSQQYRSARAAADQLKQRIEALRESHSNISTSLLEQQEDALRHQADAAEDRIRQIVYYYNKLGRLHGRMSSAYRRNAKEIERSSDSELPTRIELAIRDIDAYVPLDYRRKCERILVQIRVREITPVQQRTEYRGRGRRAGRPGAVDDPGPDSDAGKGGHSRVQGREHQAGDGRKGGTAGPDHSGGARSRWLR